MSIEFYATWENGEKESFPLAAQSVADGEWLEAAKDLNLTFYTREFPIVFFTPLEAVVALKEFTSLRDELLRRGQLDEYQVERFARLLRCFERMSTTTGWHAGIG